MVKRMKKIIAIAIVTLIIALGVGFIYIANADSSNKLVVALNKGIMKAYETEEYKSGFISTSYKNYTILHNKDVEPALEIIYTYLDQMEARSNEVLGFIPSKQLTIQIDYDKEVFKKRNTSMDAVGYYNNSINTMYLLYENVSRDIVMNVDQLHTYDDGSVYPLIGSNFKSTFSHEYTHYLVRSFLEENDISEKRIAIWFEEGFAEYMALGYREAGEDLEFVPLTEIETLKQWISKNNNNKNSDVYIESTYAIYNMINSKGESCIKEIILKCKEKEFKDSFEEVMGISLNEFNDTLQQTFSNFKTMYDKVYDEYLDSLEYRELQTSCLEKYVEVVEDNVRAYELLITIYENEKGFNEAEEFIKSCIEKYPEEPTYWRRLGFLYEDNNMNDLAKDCFVNEEKLSIE